MLGGVRDHNIGMCDMHFVSAFCALKGDISIFFSAPNNDAEGNGLRPDYWAGQAFLPRVLTHGRTLAVIWHNVNNPKIWMTHAYFNTNKFDEVRRVGGITFGRKETGYVAIYSKNPHYISEEGKYAARELIAPGRDNVWIAMMGSESEDGSFDSFIGRISATDFHSDSLGMSFVNADGDLFEFGYADGFKINGEEVKIPEYLCYSPYLKSKFGSGKFEYDYGDMKATLWSYPASV
jgi:hypothetical protein